MSDQNSKTLVIKSLDYWGKKEFSISTLISTLEKHIKDITIKNRCIVICLLVKQAISRFYEKPRISSRKKAQPKTNWKNVLLEAYHDFFYMFLKKKLRYNTPHQKFEYNILLNKE